VEAREQVNTSGKERSVLLVWSQESRECEREGQGILNDITTTANVSFSTKNVIIVQIATSELRGCMHARPAVLFAIRFAIHVTCLALILLFT
jgi:hypothetical protein